MQRGDCIPQGMDRCGLQQQVTELRVAQRTEWKLWTEDVARHRCGKQVIKNHSDRTCNKEDCSDGKSMSSFVHQVTNVDQRQRDWKPYIEDERDFPQPHPMCEHSAQYKARLQAEAPIEV